MHQESLRSATLVVAVLSATIFLSRSLQAQAPVSLQEQLNAQYKLVKMTNSGTVVVDPGTVLVVQKGGIISVPWKAVVKCSAKFENNALHPSTGFCAGMMKSVSQYFQTGNKVYPLKIDVNQEKGKVSFQVVSCDACNGVDPATGMKGEVDFQFAKGYLEKAAAPEVEDIIGTVFAISNYEGQQQQPGENDQQQGGTDQAGGQEQQQQAEPQTIQLGMTTDQVQSALGKPEKIFNLGTKQIFVYKDVKVTFLNGKVSDVQ